MQTHLRRYARPIIMKGLVLMILWARACIPVTVIIDGEVVDCSVNCVCCKGGTSRCRSDNYCYDGCVATIYGERCHNPCPGKCYTCGLITGRPCYTCTDTFYDKESFCTKNCSFGCTNGICNDDGTCSTCTSNFEGNKCDHCIQGKYGQYCSTDCDHQNCRCSNGSDCISCKLGFYDRATFCQAPCSTGCQNGVCNDDGSCQCRNQFITGSSCTNCSAGYHGEDCDTTCPIECSDGVCMRNGTCNQCNTGHYGEYCNITCSAGCNDEDCMKDGTCICKENFTGTKCEACIEVTYGLDCQKVCSIGCSRSSCTKIDGFCECRLNFTGNKCDTCTNGQYGMLCELFCSDTCVGGTCSRSDGSCTIGCIDGYSGNNCTDDCNSNCTTCQHYDKSYCTSCYNEYSGSSCRCPPNCACDEVSDQCTSCENMYSNPGYQCQCHTQFCKTNNCNACINSTFYVHEGLDSCCPCPTSCKDAVCSSQYQCLNGCVEGMYGNDCSKKCANIHRKCLSCWQDTGSCTRCDDWFYPDSNGNCIACSATCTDSKCEGGSGRCIGGCIDGYGGNQCEDRCDILCRTCDRMTGECTGCIHPSWYGPYCNLSCSSSCINYECDMIGECAIGCTEGYTGVTCTQQVTTASSGVSVGLTAGVGVIGLVVGGLVAASLTVYILKRRRRGKTPNVAELGGQRPFETGNSSIDGHNLYDQLDKKKICTPQDRQQYEMIQSSTVDNKQNGEEERDYEFAGDNEYYNER